MNSPILLFFLCLLPGILSALLLYQQYAFRTGTQAKLRGIHEKLKEILDTDSQERILVFTENKELQELTAQLNELLERHARVKADYRRMEQTSKRMLSNISHDIKTPMTVILGYLEMMRLNGGAAPEMLGKTEQKAKDVVELVNQFFTLAKLEAGDMDLTLSKIELTEICRECVLGFYEILQEKEFKVELSLPETPVFLYGNREALWRILTNLISNVIRYGSEGKYLGVFLKEEEKAVCLEVADKGPGIGAAIGNRVFDRLFTMEDSRSRSIQGNGLGLTIAKHLAEQLDGELTFESEPYVRTVFMLKLKRNILPEPLVP